MKNLIQITTVLLLLAQTMSYGQTKTTESISNEKETTQNKQDTNTEIDTQKFKHFIGTYYLAEADFELEIKEEDNKMYIVSPFSTDILVPTNDTTLRELTRGVDLELIKDDRTALKFTQNGYETTIKRVKSDTKE